MIRYGLTEQLNQVLFSFYSRRQEWINMSTKVITDERKKYVREHHVVRVMGPTDCVHCRDIFREHGFCVSSNVIETLRQLEPNACLVLTAEDDDYEILAFSVFTSRDPRVAVVTHYGVKLGYQRLGLGISVWKKMMENLKYYDNLGLCSSPAQVDTYKTKAGFIVEDDDSMVVYSKDGPTTTEKIIPTKAEEENIKVVPLSQVKWKDLLAYDQDITGFDRGKHLDIAFEEPQLLVLVALDSKSNKIIGYGVMKPSVPKMGYLGPFLCDSYSVGKCLLYHFLNNFTDSLNHGFITGMNDKQENGIRLAKEVGLEHRITCPILYTKTKMTGIKSEKIYGFLTPGVPFY